MSKLTDSELDVLWKRYFDNNDITARNMIVENYSYIVEIIAKRIRGMYQQFGDFEDIVNEGIIALIDAISKYDMTKANKFETYATIRIRGAIIDYIRKQSWIPRRVTQNKKNIRDAEKKLSNILGRQATDLEIAEHLKIDIKDYNKILFEINNANIVSFEDKINRIIGSNMVNPIFSRSTAETPESILEKEELRKVLENEINKLNDIEKLVISLYYKEGMKFKNIADILEISNSRVSQIHTKALKKLNIKLEEYENM